jgi:hypothetical protein
MTEPDSPSLAVQRRAWDALWDILLRPHSDSKETSDCLHQSDGHERDPDAFLSADNARSTRELL